jgi:hypothetical protein
MQRGPECDLSVVVVSRNVIDLTRQCLASMYENTRSISFEVILVDNGSSDGSADMVEREFPQVRLIRNEVGVGLARADNQGFDISAGRYLLPLNSDTIVQPEAFDRLVRYMDKHPNAGGATPRLILPDGGKHWMFIGKVPTPRSELLGVLAALHGKIAESVPTTRYDDSLDIEKSGEVPCILWGTAFLIRREVYEQIGGHDPRFFVYSEDVDWSLRILKAGWKLHYVADSVVAHYGGRSTQQTSVQMVAQLSRSRCRLIQKHYGWFAGIVLRMAIAFVCGTRLAKWLALYVVAGDSRSKGRERIAQMWATIRAVLV